MKPNEFTPHRRIENEYRRLIDKLLSPYLEFDEGAMPAAVLHAFSNIASNTEVIATIASAIASRMITQVKVSNARSWREAARQSSRGREIYEALEREMQTKVGTRTRELIAENAKLISSIPADVREHVNIEIASMQRQGERPETIALYLRRRIPQLTKHKAALIARTETGKASTAMTRARSEDLGINWYQWATSEDARVRSSHRLMDKVLISWDDPPSPEALAHIPSRLGKYHAGNCPNCRCDAYPIISLDVISWPARVYSSGSIRRMSRRQFVGLSGIRERAT